MSSASTRHNEKRKYHSHTQYEETKFHKSDLPQPETPQARRIATVYDAVAGKVGINGFLNGEQIRSSTTVPLKPEEVLLRRVNAPDEIPFDYYNADQSLASNRTLPDSDLLKDLHAYVADFYEQNNDPHERFDFQSCDETALIALGILLEEACKESLGDTGDMVFTEPEIYDRIKPRDMRSKHQIVGKVVPLKVTEYESPSEEESDVLRTQPRKRQRRRYRSPED